MMSFSPKPLKTLCLAFCLLLLFRGLGNAETTYDAHIQNGINHAKNQDMKSARKAFLKAAKDAKSKKDWRNLLDAGYSLLSLGEVSLAKDTFTDCQSIVSEHSEWQSSLALGFAFMSVRDSKRAERYFLESKNKSLKNEDVYGLIESAKALFSISVEPQASEALEKAQILSQNTKNIDALEEICQLLHQNKDILPYDECRRKITQLREEISNLPKPPRGWEAWGETIASPPPIPLETQKASREIADRILSEKYRWIADMKRESLRKKEQAVKYASYYTPYRPSIYPSALSTHLAWDFLRTYYTLHGLHHYIH
ncbi:hypothetical protein IID04_05565 [PVC group bacterium]|nr:hypothetical protein [PVC group bacterium]